MRIVGHFLILWTITFSFLSSAQAVPVVSNGDFETDANLFVVWPGYTSALDSGLGTGTNPAEITSFAGSGGRGINGATVATGSVAGITGIGAPITPFRDNGGNITNVAFLQGPSSINQNVSGFTASQTYVLSFDLNARSGANPTFTASIAGVSTGRANIAEVGGSNPYYKHSALFTATAASQNLLLSNAPFNGGDTTSLVDNVSIQQVSVVEIPIANGSFEANGPYTWPGTGAIASWIGGSGLNPSTGTPGCCGASPFAPDNDGGVPDLLSPDGGQFAFLQVNGVNVTKTLSQTLTGLTPGQQYFLTYYDAHRNGDAGLGATLSVQIDGVTLNSSEPSNTQWTLRSAGFIPTASSVTLAFVANNAPFNNDQTVDVDGVHLFAVVPEPAALALAVVGAVACLRFRRRIR